MQLSINTMNILKNFCSINNGIWIDKGNVLTTTSKEKSVIATAVVDNDFPVSFGIYELSTLLNIISFHKSGVPEIDFDTHHLIIVGLSGRSKIKYRFCSEDMLFVPPKKKINFPSNDIEFVLNEEDYLWVSNAAKILDVPNIAITSDGNKIFLRAFNLENDSAHDDFLEISSGNGIKYNIIFDFDIWNKIMPGSYDVKIHAKGLNSKDGIAIGKLENKFKELEYLLLVHAESTYDM